MLLTKRKLNAILRDRRLSISPELETGLLAQYGNPATDDEGHPHEYTEQDICEQLRKRLCHHENFNKEVPALQ